VTRDPTTAAHINTRHDAIELGGVVVPTLQAWSVDRMALKQQLRRARVKQVALDTVAATSIDLATEDDALSRGLHSKFLELQKSYEFTVRYPVGSVQRYVWDDQMQNNARAAEGKSKRSFRYSVPTLKWALRRLIKDGASSYDELSVVLGLPSARLGYRVWCVLV
jgi:hypothetical protein